MEKSSSASPSRNGRTKLDSQRIEPTPGRVDDLNPFSRHGDSVSSITKGGVLSQRGTSSSAYRWTMALGGERDLSKPYAQHPWVYACVAAIGRASSSVPMRLQRELAGGEYEEVLGTDLGHLFEMPNPLQSQRKFFRSIATSQQLYGETFLILLKRSSSGSMGPVQTVGGAEGMMAMIEMPDEVWPVRGDMVEAEIDEATRMPAAWKIPSGASYVTYPAHAVVQIAEVNPYNPLRGLGPMQAAYRTAAKDFVIDRYDEALLQNGGSPGGVLSVDGPLTDADQRAIREAWQEAQGRPEQHRKTAVLPKGTSYTEIGMSPQAMEHEKLRDWDRQTILSIFGVPPVILGLETINYATAKEQNRIFWETTVTPYLDFLTDELRYKFIRRIATPESELILDFDRSGVAALREDVDSKVERTIKLYERGHRSFAEAARLAGWDIADEELEGADERWIPNNYIPVDLAGEPGAEPEPPAERFDEEEDRHIWAKGMEEEGSPWPSYVDTEDKREEYYRTYTAAEDVSIEKAEKKISRVYRDMVLSIRARLIEIAEGEKAAPSSLVTKQIYTEAELSRLLQIDLLKWGDEVAASILPGLEQALLMGAGSLASELAAAPMLTSVTDPFVLDFYRGYGVYLAELPTSTLAQEVQRGILRVLESSDVSSTTSLARAIEETLERLKSEMKVMLDRVPYRAGIIARTEVAKAHNGARMEEMKRQGVEIHKWLTSLDDTVRDLHQEMAGKEAKVGDPFQNGVRFPGEGGEGISAAEVVNCRCTTIPIVQ